MLRTPSAGAIVRLPKGSSLRCPSVSWLQSGCGILTREVRCASLVGQVLRDCASEPHNCVGAPGSKLDDLAASLKSRHVEGVVTVGSDVLASRGSCKARADIDSCAILWQVIHGARSRPKQYPVQKWAIKQAGFSKGRIYTCERTPLLSKHRSADRRLPHWFLAGEGFHAIGPCRAHGSSR